jgi:hypothetical protein
MSLVLRLDLVAVYVPMVVALLYFGLIRLFGISRHQRQSGVILGLGINSLAEFVALVPRWVYGIKTVAFVAWIPPLGYVLAEIIWVIELLRPEPPVDPRLAQLSPKEVNEVLGQYVRVLRTLTKKSK